MQHQIRRHSILPTIFMSGRLITMDLRHTCSTTSCTRQGSNARTFIVLTLIIFLTVHILCICLQLKKSSVFKNWTSRSDFGAQHPTQCGRFGESFRLWRILKAATRNPNLIIYLMLFVEWQDFVVKFLLLDYRFYI